ncbi:MAG: tetratricopeptide repeat protein [Pseudarcicella sp.]|nr:tetratricopeptide repeat protein [Pseudarcicella sp.]
MKILIITLFFALLCSIGFAQNKLIDSLSHGLNIATSDTSRVKVLAELCYEYRHSKPDTAIRYGQQALDLARRIHYSNGEATALSSIGFVYRGLGDLQNSLSLQQKALAIAEQNIKSDETAKSLFGIGAIYVDLKDYSKALNNYKKALSLYQLNDNKKKVAILWVNIGDVYEKVNQLDSALYCTQKGYQLMPSLASISEKSYALRVLTKIYIKLNQLDLAISTSRMGIKAAIDQGNIRDQGFCYYLIAEVYKARNQIDSCIYYAKKALYFSQICKYRLVIIDASTLLAEIYEPKDSKLSLYYFKIAKETNEEIYGAKKILDLQKTIAEEQERQSQKEAIRIKYETQLKQYVLLAGLAILLLVAFFLYRNNQKEKKAKNLLQEQKDKVQSTLSTLKATQAQLIQSEKLASLGELTAGIAHEIQNPLNFVNNFSEVSVELVQEIKEERQKPKENQDDSLVDEIFKDIFQNLEKITLHGKRASSIVKGMLEHSRASTGEKELTDINVLADEYLRLSYHGLRAKDSSFNADFKTNFDENLPKIEVIPQDFGRVLLNLINNAFYATKGVKSPLVEIKTERLENGVTISVKDNGSGMTEATKAKIFQPFFTTKPTGEGTGLGLSLAYDIVTKGHGGTIEVESVEDEGSIFLITLPLKTV